MKGKDLFSVNEPVSRKILAFGWNFLSRLLLGMNFRDTQAGAKFFKKSFFDKIDKKLTCKGFDFDIELLYKLKKAGARIKEAYVPIKNEKFSTFRIKFVPGMFWRMLKMWSKNA